MDKITDKPLTICFIAGAGHSGSTLLGCVLGSHSQLFYGGEMAKTRLFNQPEKPLHKKVCRLCGEDCPVWAQFDSSSALSAHEQLAEISGQRWLVDSSKRLEWQRTQAAYLQRKGYRVCLVFLKRDGRAVVNSRRRKGKRPLHKIIKHWQLQIEGSQQWYDEFNGRKTTVRYEAFCHNPQATAQRLCRLLGIDFEAEMLNFTKTMHHLLGGNAGTQYQIMQQHRSKTSASLVRLQQKRIQYYRNYQADIQCDSRWKQEMSYEHLQLFEEMAGVTNRQICLLSD